MGKLYLRNIISFCHPQLDWGCVVDCERIPNRVRNDFGKCGVSVRVILLFAWGSVSKGRES